MIHKRCPHCGNILPRVNKSFRIFRVCPFCKKNYRVHFPKDLMMGIPYSIYLLVYAFSNLAENRFAHITAIVFTVLFSWIIAIRIPFEKYEVGDIVSCYSPDDRVFCEIEWEKDFRFRKYALICSGSILPVCFFDENNIPISHTWCAVLRKVRHRRKRTTCRFEFVLQDAPQELLLVGNRFRIFHNNKPIGTGTITKVDV